MTHEYTNHMSTGIQSPKGNEILAMIKSTKEGTWVAIKPLCTTLRLSWGGQYEKLIGDPKFSCADIRMTGVDGKQYQMLCLPAEQVASWVTSINSNKVAAEKAQALLELQKFFQSGLNELSRGRLMTDADVGIKVEALQKALEAVLNRLEIVEAENAYHRAGQQRFESAEKSAAGTRLVQERWARRDRTNLRVVN